MFEKLVNMFFSVDVLDIHVTPEMIEITTSNNGKRTADLIYNDVVKFAYDWDYDIQTYDNCTPYFNGLYNDTDGYMYEIDFYKDDVLIARVEIYFH